MTLKECYAILNLSENVELGEVKQAYRKLAFALHPDLNPNVPDAAQRFQRLNEAYVQLSQHYSSRGQKTRGFSAAAEEASARAREEAQKAYTKAKQGQEHARSSARSDKDPGKEEILKDILNDPFARRVFEDIYSHIRHERPGARGAESGTPHAHTPFKQQEQRKRPPTRPRPVTPQPENKVVSKVKGWLRKQIDDEQVLRLPGESLVPGARVRLQIQHGFSGEPEIVELTLPPEFVPGKAMRLKGMGRRVGGWRGDLYVRIEPA